MICYKFKFNHKDGIRTSQLKPKDNKKGKENIKKSNSKEGCRYRYIGQHIVVKITHRHARSLQRRLAHCNNAISQL